MRRTQTEATDPRQFLRDGPNITSASPHPPERPRASQSAKLCVVQLLSNRACGKACYTLTNEVRPSRYSLIFHVFGSCWADISPQSFRLTHLRRTTTQHQNTRHTGAGEEVIHFKGPISEIWLPVTGHRVQSCHTARENEAGVENGLE